jgi:hypothetical protein
MKKKNLKASLPNSSSPWARNKTRPFFARLVAYKAVRFCLGDLRVGLMPNSTSAFVRCASQQAASIFTTLAASLRKRNR